MLVWNIILFTVTIKKIYLPKQCDDYRAVTKEQIFYMKISDIN